MLVDSELIARVIKQVIRVFGIEVKIYNNDEEVRQYLEKEDGDKIPGLIYIEQNPTRLVTAIRNNPKIKKQPAILYSNPSKYNIEKSQRKISRGKILCGRFARASS